MQARIGFLTAWDMDDEYAWSGVCFRAVRSLEALEEIQRLPAVTVKPAALDRLAAKILGRFQLGYLIDHSLMTALKRSWANRRLVKESGVSTVFACAASVDTILLPQHVRVIQITDSSFIAMANTYFHREGRLGRLSLWQGSLIDWLVSRRSNHFSLASNWSQEVMIRDLGIPLSKTSVIPFGPGTIPFHRAEKWSGQGALKVIFIGSDWHRKGGEEVIRAVSRARVRRPIELTVVGALAQDLPEWVNQLPRLNRADLSAAYARHHLLIELSSASAGGVVVTDAIAHGLAVIATDIGGLKTLVQDNGWRVSPHSSAAEAANLLETLSATEIARAQKVADAMYRQEYNWSQWAQKVLALADT